MGRSISSTSRARLLAIEATQKRRKRALLLASLAGVLSVQVLLPHIAKVPMYDSSRTGEHHIKELLAGHPLRFYHEFGMSKHVFLKLREELVIHSGFHDTKHVSMNEQLAIFLRFCRSGAGTRKIREEFQRGPDTISKVFNRVLDMIISYPFYTQYIKLPTGVSVPPKIYNDTKLYPFFKDCLGAIDGTHINMFVPERDIARYRNRKGTISQNVLAACSFDLRFLYVRAGWEGSAGDGRIYEDARRDDFTVPPGKYYLADAGFPSCNTLLVPYRNTRYHLKEWERSSIAPQNYKELFNLRHSQTRNVVERIFGVVKRRFQLLIAAPEYPLHTQAKLVLAVCALHNFICSYDPNDAMEYDEEEPPQQLPIAQDNELGHSVSREETRQSNIRRDQIAQDMWAQYQEYLNDE